MTMIAGFKKTAFYSPYIRNGILEWNDRTQTT